MLPMGTIRGQSTDEPLFLILAGKKGKSFEGSLQPAAREVFQDDKQAVKCDLKFTAQ